MTTKEEQWAVVFTGRTHGGIKDWRWANVVGPFSTKTKAKAYKVKALRQKGAIDSESFEVALARFGSPEYWDS